MRKGSVIRGMGIAVSTCVLGVVGYWWFLQASASDPQNLLATREQSAADRHATEKTQARLRTENQHLQQDNAALQVSIAEVSRRLEALEDTQVPQAGERGETAVVELKGRVAALEDTRKALKAGIDTSEKTSAQLRIENQHLQQDNAALQASIAEISRRLMTLEDTQVMQEEERPGTAVAELKGRVAALEDTKRTLQDTIEGMKKQLGASIPTRKRVQAVSEQKRRVQSHAALGKNKQKPGKEGTNVQVASRDSRTMQSLAKDKLALLLVTFLVKYTDQKTQWFNAPSIQSVSSEQEGYDLFQYHSWTTLDAMLRRLEGAGLVRGRDDENLRVERQFAIRQGSRLTTFQTLASRE